ncbi:hypothetical protein A5666_28865 [Mycolicibacterium fortuitum]|nr:hypothetical protein A5665_14025 [Mycolicibacterium fortuitum]OBI67758.1 hypothetical protein A5666_28865 [Mycolicibacterium fortuitum]
MNPGADREVPNGFRRVVGGNGFVCGGLALELLLRASEGFLELRVVYPPRLARAFHGRSMPTGGDIFARDLSSKFLTILAGTMCRETGPTVLASAGDMSWPTSSRFLTPAYLGM